MRKFALTAILTFMPLCYTHAALYDRGNGLVYDSTLNITWLLDMNYAQSSGYDVDGRMAWANAKAWASGLSYDGVTGWRLPSAKLTGAECCSYAGTTDNSWNNVTSELGHLFFVDLGNKAQYDTSGTPLAIYGLTNTTFMDASSNTLKSFLHMQNGVYWLDEQYAPDPTKSWVFGTYSGHQGYGPASSDATLLAVHDGDVAAIPIPTSITLFFSALVPLFRRYHKRELK